MRRRTGEGFADLLVVLLILLILVGHVEGLPLAPVDVVVELAAVVHLPDGVADEAVDELTSGGASHNKEHVASVRREERVVQREAACGGRRGGHVAGADALAESRAGRAGGRAGQGTGDGGDHRAVEGVRATDDGTTGGGGAREPELLRRC